MLQEQGKCFRLPNNFILSLFLKKLHPSSSATAVLVYVPYCIRHGPMGEKRIRYVRFVRIISGAGIPRGSGHHRYPYGTRIIADYALGSAIRHNATVPYCSNTTMSIICPPEGPLDYALGSVEGDSPIS